MKRFLLTLSVLVLMGCQSSPDPTGQVDIAASPESGAKVRTLTAVGDSLTEGLGVEQTEAYPAQLEKRLIDDGMTWRVVNAGVSGETSSGALTRLGWILKTKPDAVLLVTGANDGLRGIDPKLTRDNIRAIVVELKKNEVEVMLAGMKALPNLGEDYAREFDAIYEQVSKDQQVPLIPFFLEGVARDPAFNQEDGKHPTAEGYSKVVDHIYPDVKSWLEKQASQ